MEQGTETWVSRPKRIEQNTNRRACLIHIYPTGPGMGSCHALNETTLVLGRDNDCQICINDHSVSRRHARIQPVVDGHCLFDLNSTNGCFINDHPVSAQKLKDGDYVRLGNWIFRYLSGTNVEAQYHEEIYRLTIIDGLTGIPNKRYFIEFLDREIARSFRHRRPLALILLDIDRFKAINDQLGHLAGDFILRELAACIKGAIRKEELFARYGGEEFAIVLPETTGAGAAEMAERIRQLVEAQPFEFEGNRNMVTISLGVCSTRGDEPLTPAELIRQADAKLYEAKRAGRNRVVA